MTDYLAAREALVIEAIGEVGALIESLERLTPEFQAAVREASQANAALRQSLASFEGEIKAMSDKLKLHMISYIMEHTDLAAQRSIELQVKAMAEAARAAFGTELAGGMQRLLRVIQPLLDQHQRRWEEWLTHAAAAATGSAVTWVLAGMPWPS